MVYLFTDTILLCLWTNTKTILQFVANIPFSALKVENAGETKIILRMDKDNFWILRCESQQQKDKWLNDIHEVLETYKLHEIIESSITLNIKEGFHLISAKYGILTSKSKSKDVTEVLQQIIKGQGGKQLILRAEPKSTIFGNPAEGRRKQLDIVYSDNGNIKRQLYQDNDGVILPSV